MPSARRSGVAAQRGDLLYRAPEKIDRHDDLPFGIEPSICIGAGFALQETTLVLASIMRNFNITLAPHQTVWPGSNSPCARATPLLLLRAEPR
ncbi:MAG: cytochrome P450 [Xanthobacteraceae bacterium]|jgi:cytochrome P450